MPRTKIANLQNLITALANGNACFSLVPAAAANFKIIRLNFGVSAAGGAITDFDVCVGLNRATARGTATTTLTMERCDPASAASGITGADVAWSVQPTLAATDSDSFCFNSRGGGVWNFTEQDWISDVGTTKPLVLVNRSGAALPASHAITVAAEILE